MNEVPEVFPAYRLVAEFADGQRLTILTASPSSRRKTAWRRRRPNTAIYAGMTA